MFDSIWEAENPNSVVLALVMVLWLHHVNVDGITARQIESKADASYIMCHLGRGDARVWGTVGLPLLTHLGEL